MSTGAPAGRTQELRVPCPHCGAQSVYTGNNPFRPFCSERCKKNDFGAWASENFRMPTDTPPDEMFGDPRAQ